ncbi:MAG: hypothetical protein Q8O95_00535 [bacterium]|nr:hypothetical protein [bacterium]
MALDFKSIAGKAGLDDVQAEHFVEGCEGRENSPLILPRNTQGTDLYTPLQTEMERTLFAYIQEHGVGQLSLPVFLMLIEKLSTPSYRKSHPRFDIIRTLASYRPGPLQVQVCSKEGVEAMKLISDEKDHLRRFFAIIAEPHVSVHQNPNENASFIAISLPDQSLPIVFTAKQIPTGQEQGPGMETGTVIFGSQAEEMRNLALRYHDINVTAGRTRTYIQRLLGLTP